MSNYYRAMNEDFGNNTESKGGKMNREIHLENMLFELEARIDKIEDTLKELKKIVAHDNLDSYYEWLTTKTNREKTDV